MSVELETAAMASAGATASGGGGDAQKTCRNCGTAVDGKYCGECGQLAQSFHRPVIGLIGEVFADFFSFDGRVARTIPALIFNPGKVTEAYLDGKRQSYVPPFRLYLLSSLLFFITLFFVVDRAGWTKFHDFSENEGVIEMFEGDDEDSSEGDDAVIDAPEAVEEKEGWLLENGRVNRERIFRAIDSDIETKDSALDESVVNDLLKDVVNSAADVYENPPVFFSSLREWAPRFILIMAPLTILSLIFVFPFRRGIYVYHHVISALHYQTWLYIVSTFAVIACAFGQFWFLGLFAIAPKIYFYRLIRRVYKSGRILGFLRMLLVTGFLELAMLFILLIVMSFSATETSEIIQNSIR